MTHCHTSLKIICFHGLLPWLTQANNSWFLSLVQMFQRELPVSISASSCLHTTLRSNVLERVDIVIDHGSESRSILYSGWLQHGTTSISSSSCSLIRNTFCSLIIQLYLRLSNISIWSDSLLHTHWLFGYIFGPSPLKAESRCKASKVVASIIFIVCIWNQRELPHDTLCTSLTFVPFVLEEVYFDLINWATATSSLQLLLYAPIPPNSYIHAYHSPSVSQQISHSIIHSSMICLRMNKTQVQKGTCCYNCTQVLASEGDNPSEHLLSVPSQYLHASIIVSVPSFRGSSYASMHSVLPLWICCLGYLSELLLLWYFVRSFHYDRDHPTKLERECDRRTKYLPVRRILGSFHGVLLHSWQCDFVFPLFCPLIIRLS